MNFNGGGAKVSIPRGQDQANWYNGEAWLANGHQKGSGNLNQEQLKRDGLLSMPTTSFSPRLSPVYNYGQMVQLERPRMSHFLESITKMAKMNGSAMHTNVTFVL